MNKFFCLFFCLFAALANADTDPFAAVPVQVLAFHQRINGEACKYGADYADDSIGAVASAHDIGQDWRLFLVPCEVGAYQTGFRAYVAKADLSEIDQLFFVRWSSESGIYGTPQLGESRFQEGMIHGHSVGRAIGDCGEDDLYQLKVSSGDVRVVVHAIRAKESCDGNMSPWPILFPNK